METNKKYTLEEVRAALSSNKDIDYIEKMLNNIDIQKNGSSLKVTDKRLNEPGSFPSLRIVDARFGFYVWPALPKKDLNYLEQIFVNLLPGHTDFGPPHIHSFITPDFEKILFMPEHYVYETIGKITRCDEVIITEPNLSKKFNEIQKKIIIESNIDREIVITMYPSKKFAEMGARGEYFDYDKEDILANLE